MYSCRKFFKLMYNGVLRHNPTLVSWRRFRKEFFFAIDIDKGSLTEDIYFWRYFLFRSQIVGGRETWHIRSNHQWLRISAKSHCQTSGPIRFRHLYMFRWKCFRQSRRVYKTTRYIIIIDIARENFCNKFLQFYYKKKIPY